MLLLIKDDHRLVSIRPEQAATAYVPDVRHHQFERARDFLHRLVQDDHWFRAVLVDAVFAGSEGAQTGQSITELIDAAAAAIATGTIGVVRPMPPRWTVFFDRHRPRLARIDCVGIPNHGSAMHVARLILADRGSAAALEQALHHMAGERGLRSVSPSAAAKLLGQPVPDPPTWPPEFGLTVEQIARLFRGYWLVLRPRSWDGRRFDLAWAVHSSGGTDDTDSAADDPAPARRPVPPPQVEGPRSQLPVPTGTPSPQLEALIAAAAAGVPFCEECLAAALAGGANAV